MNFDWKTCYRYYHSEAHPSRDAGVSPSHLPASCAPEGVSEVLMKVALSNIYES